MLRTAHFHSKPAILHFRLCLGAALLCATLGVGAAHAAPMVSTGDNNSAAIKADGTLWVWGDNSYGQLANGNYLTSDVPVQVTNIPLYAPLSLKHFTISAVGTGLGHYLALRSDGTVWAWGLNNYGQLGNGTTTGSTVPDTVPGLNGITALSAAGFYTLALKTDGTVWAWGGNAQGQLGNGSKTESHIPVKVSNLSGVVAIAAGPLHALALKSDGTVWAWGFNGSGQLGDGTSVTSTVPVQVSGLSGVRAVSAGLIHSVALKTDGTVWTWGGNSNGQLGNGGTAFSSVPVQVSGLPRIASISAEPYGTAAVTPIYPLAIYPPTYFGGDVWSWGRNDSGQLGFAPASVAYSTIPLKMPGITHVVEVSSYAHIIAREANNSVWGWGENTSGELGAGSIGAYTYVPLKTVGF